MHGRQVQRALAATALALGAGAAAAIDFDDPNARPLHFAMETLSEDFVTRFVEPGGQVTYYNLEVPVPVGGVAHAALRHGGLPELQVHQHDEVARTPAGTAPGA